METDTTVCFSDNWWWIAKEAQKPTLQFPPIFVPAVTKSIGSTEIIDEIVDSSYDVIDAF